jgi:hypothetical protein
MSVSQIAKLAEATGLSLGDVGKMSQDQRKILAAQAKPMGKTTAIPRVTLISPVPMALPAEGVIAAAGSALAKEDAEDEEDEEEDESGETESDVRPEPHSLSVSP